MPEPTPPDRARPRKGTLVMSASVTAAAMAALVGPLLSGTTAGTQRAAGSQAGAIAGSSTVADRLAAVERSARSSRSARRAAAAVGESSILRSGDAGSLPVPEPEPEIVGTRYATTELNVRTKPDMDARVVATLDYADKVKITDVTEDEWRQVVFEGETRWVKSTFLAKSKPDPRPAGPSDAPCASGSGVEGGLAANTIAVHRAVCNAFPSVSTYGGRRGSGGNHGSGHALDIMVSGGTGDAIASYVRAHAGGLGVSEVIWQQHIWTVQRSGEGWRWMSDRGSATANHMDHVHVSTY